MRKARRTIDKYLKAVLRETYTVQTYGCGVVRYYTLYLGKHILGSGTLEEGSFEDIRPLKHELNRSRSKRNFVAKLERSQLS
jgi:hypothetical protein